MKMSVGNKLFALRKERGLTQEDMALLLEEAETTYARYERGESKVDYKKLVKFSDKLNVSIGEFLPETSAIHNTSNDSIQSSGGPIFFGSQYQIYMGDSVIHSQLAKENQELKEKLASLEQKLEALLKKL